MTTTELHVDCATKLAALTLSIKAIRDSGWLFDGAPVGLLDWEQTESGDGENSMDYFYKVSNIKTGKPYANVLICYYYEGGWNLNSIEKIG